MKIAVVGGGISGLTAAYLLKDLHEVALFEGQDRLGGHTHTVQVESDSGKLAIDTGFIVFNDWTYPNFIRLLDRLGVKSQLSDMSFSVRRDSDGLEYNGSSLSQLFVQRKNALSLSYLRMLRGILKFNRLAKEAAEVLPAEVTLGDFLSRWKIPASTQELYVIPITAAIWSTPSLKVPEMSAVFLFRFMKNHGMLNLKDRPKWRTIGAGAKTYVDRIASQIRVLTGTPVKSVKRRGHGVCVRTPNEETVFDHVILACHSDEALGMLDEPSSAEGSILKSIPYQKNLAVLHTDQRFLPKNKKAWAAWNYHLSENGNKVSLTYNMNILQSLSADQTYCVTLNPVEEIAPNRILRVIEYSHPVLTVEGVVAQSRLDEISGRDRISYAGAYWGNGFHEDGVVSALRACEPLGGKL